MVTRYRKHLEKMMQWYGLGRIAEPDESFQIFTAHSVTSYASVQDQTWGSLGLHNQNTTATLHERMQKTVSFGAHRYGKLGGVLPLGWWEVQGESGRDWTEMVEVAEHMNGDGDGYTYYVGSPYTAAVLKPSWREMKELADFAARFPNSPASTEETMAWALMVGGKDWNEAVYR